MKRLFLLLLCLPLSGCFSLYIMVQAGEQEKKRQQPARDPVSAYLDTRPKVVQAEFLCNNGHSTNWHMKLGSQVMYLTVPDPEGGRMAVLAPTEPICRDANGRSVPAPKQDYWSRRERALSSTGHVAALSLVVTQKEIPFVPRDSGGLPTLACLRLEVGELQEEDSLQALVAPFHSLVYSNDGKATITQVKLEMEPFYEKSARRAGGLIRLLLWGSVPLDLATAIFLYQYFDVDGVLLAEVMAGVTLVGILFALTLDVNGSGYGR